MKKILWIFFLFLLVGNAQAVPSATLSIAPSAAAGTTITAADENDRNGDVSTWANAHDHNDIDQVGNTLAVGDAATGNKTIQANNADVNKPHIRYNDSSDMWVISGDGSNSVSLQPVTGTDLTNNTIRWGNGTTGNKDIGANNADASKPFIRYDDTNDRWEVSHDGSTVQSLMVTTGASVNHRILPATAPLGAMLYANGNSWQLITVGSAGQAIRSRSGIPTWESWTPGMGTFTRDVSLAAGDQAITGVGFEPSSVTIVCNVSSAAATSIGFGTEAASSALINRHSESANVWGTGATIISMVSGVGTEGNATLNTLDDNGFTLSWTKVGSPTGTASCRYIAYR